ncbi:MAG: hypothetical protein ACRCZF_24655 [Gemmataceae bacterium]
MRRLLMVSLILAGCTASSSGPPTPAPATNASVDKPSPKHDHDHDHDHERDRKLITHAGPYHALLTAHLSKKDGHELDIYFETEDDQPVPVALPIAEFTATITTMDNMKFEVTFRPAPANERPKDEPAGSASHFVAKAPQLKPELEVMVTCILDIKNRTRTVTWKKFQPNKYAHHID